MPERSIQDVIRAEAARAQIPAELALSVAEQESAFNPNAINPESGATGVFQFLPATAKQRGIDPADPLQNIRGGVDYLRELLDQHQGDLHKVLATYGGVKTNTTYVPGVLGRIQKFRNAATAQPGLSKLSLAQTSEDAEGIALKPKLPTSLPGPTPPGAPPRPQTFERTGTQTAVQIARNTGALPILGSMVGGTVGALAGGPSIIGIPAAAVAGSSAGSVGGEGVQMALEKAVGLSGEGGPPVPRLLRAGAEGALGEGTGQLLTRGVTKVAAPFVKKMTTEGYEAIRSMGGKVLPAQVTQSRILDILQNVSEGSILGGGKVKAFKESQNSIIDGLVDRTLAKYGGKTSGEEAGQAFVDALDGNIDSFHKAGSKLFKEVDDLVGGAPVVTDDIKQWAVTELNRRSAIPGELTGDSGLNMLKQMAALPDTITFEQGQFLRSELLKKGRSIADPNKDVTKAIAQQLAGRTDTALEQTAQSLGGDAEAAFRAANAFWKDGKAQFETKFLRKLIEQEPDAVAARLLQGHKPVTIRQAREAVPAAAWRKVQGGAATKLIDTATDVESGAISGKRLLTQIKTLGGSFTELFPQTADEIKRLGRTLSVVQQGQGEGTGRMFIQLAQGGAIAGALGGGIFTGNASEGLGTAGVILLGPQAIARIMTSPRGIRWLTTGLTAPRGSEAAIRAAANLSAWLGRKEYEEETSGPPPVPQSKLPIGYEAPPRPASVGQAQPQP